MITAGPGEYVSDVTEGITCVENLPKANPSSAVWAKINFFENFYR